MTTKKELPQVTVPTVKTEQNRVKDIRYKVKV